MLAAPQHRRRAAGRAACGGRRGQAGPAREDVEVTASVPRQARRACRRRKATCANPDALGVSRVVVIDTTGGPGFGFQHFKQLDFLTDKEVVLTFDDGPWPGNTPAVLKALADECTKGVFFPIGKHATYHPEILRQVAAAGHTVGAHTWSHANLEQQEDDGAAGQGRDREGLQRGQAGAGRSARAVLPFSGTAAWPGRDGLSRHRATSRCSPATSTPSISARRTPTQIVNTVMTKLDKQGKGIILMHDFQKHTAEALPTLLRRLKAGGYKVVQMKAKTPLQTLPEYDDALVKEMKLPVASARPVGSVVQTVSE